MSFKPPIITNMVMAMIGVGLSYRIQTLVISNYSAPLTACDRLDRIKRKASHLTERAECPSVKTTANGLAGVLYENEPPFLAKATHCINTGHSPTHVNEQNSLCTGGDNSLNGLRVKTQRIINISKYRYGTGIQYCLNGGYEGKWRNNHFVTSSNPARGQGYAES